MKHRRRTACALVVLSLIVSVLSFATAGEAEALCQVDNNCATACHSNFAVNGMYEDPVFRIYSGSATTTVSCSQGANINVSAEIYGTGLNVNQRVTDLVRTATCLNELTCSVTVQWSGQLPTPLTPVPCMVALGTAVAELDPTNAQQLATTSSPALRCSLPPVSGVAAAPYVNYVLSTGSNLGLPSARVYVDGSPDPSFEVGPDAEDSVSIGSTPVVCTSQVCADGSGQAVPSDACDGFKLYYNANNGRYIMMRYGYWNGNRGFGYRKLVAKGRWAAYGDKLEQTLRYGYRFGKAYPNSGAAYEWCDPDTGNQYRVVVNEGDGTYQNMKGVITGYLLSNP